MTVTATDTENETATATVTITLEDLPAVSIETRQERVLMSDGLVRFTFSATPRPTEDIRVPVAGVQDHAWFDIGDQTIDYIERDNETAPARFVFLPNAPVRGGDLTATLQAGEGYELGTPASATVEVVAADPLVTVRFAAASAAAAEDDGTVAATVRAETVAGAPKPLASVYADWSTTADTAAAPGDYTAATAQRLAFAPSGLRPVRGPLGSGADGDVTLRNDNAKESRERFLLTLGRRTDTHRLVQLANPDGTLCRDNAAGVNCGMEIVVTDDDNAAPTFPGAPYARSVAENSPPGTAVGSPVAADRHRRHDARVRPRRHGRGVVRRRPGHRAAQHRRRGGVRLRGHEHLRADGVRHRRQLHRLRGGDGDADRRRRRRARSSRARR